MDLSRIGISVTKLSNSTNYIDIYDILSYQKIISVLPDKNKSLLLLLSSGKIIKFDPESPPGKLYVESIWEQYISCEIVSALLLESYPCIFYLSNMSILYLTSTEGDIHTAQPKHILASSLNLSYVLLSFSYNISKNLILSVSANYIQVLCINNKKELVPFAPFQPSCQKFVCENCVVFSKKHSNTIYYLDYLQDPSSDNISFNKESSTYYTLKKCNIDHEEISESKLHIVSYESELASYDINIQDIFVFLTAKQYLYVLKGNKTNGVRVFCDDTLTKVRWNSTSTLIIILSVNSNVILYDNCLNKLSVISDSYVQPCLSLSSDGLLEKIESLLVSSSLIFATNTNIAVCKVLENELVPIPSHLKKGNFTEALSCLDSIPLDSDFAKGFYLCWKYVYDNLEIEYVKALENIWTRNSHSRLPGNTGSHLLMRLGYRLLNSNSFEAAYLLGKKLKSIRLLNDVAYYADFQGFHGIALIAKHERELMDPDYVCPRAELENLIKITGRNMTSSDYCLLLNDFEEIINISRISEALGKGGYLEEKNFWEIDLESYANALMLEGEGRFTEALDIYTAQNLTNEINRVNLIISQSSKTISAKESIVDMTEE